MIRSLILPEWTDGNPYLLLLQKALAGRDIHASFASELGAAHPLREMARGQGPQILHFHWTEPFISGTSTTTALRRATRFVTALLLLRLRGCQLVWTVHNLERHDALHPRLELLAHQLLARIAHALIVHHPIADGITRRKFRLSPSKRILVAPHPHFIGAYPTGVDRATARSKLGLNANHRVFLFFGALRHYKRIPILVEAFRGVTRKDARLLIAGRCSSSEYERTLREMCRSDDRITLEPGTVPSKQVQIWMSAADAVVLPQDQVLTSGSAVLAMSFGKALIAHDSPHIRFLLGSESPGIYKPNDPAILRGILEDALSNWDFQAIGRHNRARIEEFSWDDMAKVVEQAYARVALEDSLTNCSHTIMRC